MKTFLSSNPNEIARALNDQNRQVEESQTQKKALSLGLPYINLKNFPVNLNSLSLISKPDSEQSECLVFFKDAHDIRLATINPNNQLLNEKIHNLEKLGRVGVYYVSKSSFADVSKFYNKVVGVTQKTDQTVKVTGSEISKDVWSKLSDDQNISASEFLEIMFTQAIAEQSSDIHIEPEAQNAKIRFRIDGVLHEKINISKKTYNLVVARLKLISKLKLNVTNLPQDGRFSVENSNTSIDIRVSVLPSSSGEAVVMRLLGIGAVDLKVSNLGLAGKALEIIQRQLQKPNGMIITTGPTGSGKTTTLYAFLNQLNDPGVKIITLEDPVEYKLEGIQQTPIDHHVNFDFAAGLRSILRQDPDIVMVGEIRDTETAETALQAALTGHIVLSTLHTNDASGAIPRLITMGTKPFTVAPALNAIIAQRLIRKLCLSCRKKTELSAEQKNKIDSIINALPSDNKLSIPQEYQIFTPVGCSECSNIGYKGRIGVYEVIEVNDSLREHILQEPSGLTIKKLARENGTFSIFEDAIVKAVSGITDIDEVYRVVGE